MLSREAVGLVVVHGIGDPAPGEVLRDLTDSLSDARLATFDTVIQDMRFPDTVRSTSTRRVFFPAHFRTGWTPAGPGLGAKRELVAAEVFWGSASQLAPGQWGVLQGMASLLLNVPALVVGADDGSKGITGFLHRMAWFASMLLAGPMLAFNIVLLLALGLYIGFCSAVGIPGRPGELLIVVLTVAGSIALTRHDWLWFPEAQWSLRIAGVAAFVGMIWTGFSLQGFAIAGTRVLVIAVLVVSALVLFLGIYFCAAGLARKLTPSCHTVMLVVSLQLGFWALTLPLTAQVMQRALQRIQAKSIPELSGPVIAADGLQWTLVGFVVLVIALVVGMRLVHARIESARVTAGGKLAEARPARRLIVHPLIATALVGAAMLGASAMLLSVLTEWAPNRAMMVGTVVDIAGMAVVVLPLSITQLRLGLDLAHDVIFYIYYRCDCGRELLKRTRDPRKEQTVVNPMRARVSAVLRHLVDDLGVQQLVIVAHSQGSIIAVDELKNFVSTRPLPPVSLVTCGSPVTDLYQHYFPTVYPEWQDDVWKPLFGRIGRWGNFYRLDDYVGTRITPPQGLCEFHQESIGPGGHTNYWRDPRFIAALGAWGLFDIPVRPRPSREVAMVAVGVTAPGSPGAVATASA